MNQQDTISSYIDNELSAEAEQEFLISLAASESLRRSFRSELTMKNILREDDRTVNPPRSMRNAVFSAVGLSAAPAAGGGASVASRGLFATKLQTLVSALALAGSMTVGYVAHDMLRPSSEVHSQPAVTTTVPGSTTLTPPTSAQPSTTNPTTTQSQTATTQPVRAHKHHAVQTAQQTVSSETKPAVGSTSLPGDVKVDPQIQSSSKK